MVSLQVLVQIRVLISSVIGSNISSDSRDLCTVSSSGMFHVQDRFVLLGSWSDVIISNSDRCRDILIMSSLVCTLF
jgi:hypothetical protein